MKEMKLDPTKMAPPTVITEDRSQFNFFSDTGQPLDWVSENLCKRHNHTQVAVEMCQQNSQDADRAWPHCTPDKSCPVTPVCLP